MTVTQMHVQMRRADAVRNQLQTELDRRDEELVRLIEARTRLARLIADRRLDAGGSRFVHSLELATVTRFRRLGRLGTEMAALLVRLSRTTAVRSDGGCARV
jgi:chorismate mutase